LVYFLGQDSTLQITNLSLNSKISSLIIIILSCYWNDEFGIISMDGFMSLRHGQIILIIILWNLTFLRIFVYEKLYLNFHERTFLDELYILIYIHYNSFSFIYSKKMYENKWVCDLVGLKSHQVDVFWILIWVYDSFLETFESDHWVLNSINF